MRKFKLLLTIFLLPITFIIYYLTSDEYGIPSYIDKQKTLDKTQIENENIRAEISAYIKKIDLLNAKNPNIDLLNEKAFELLGVSEKDTIVINTDNL